MKKKKSVSLDLTTNKTTVKEQPTLLEMPMPESYQMGLEDYIVEFENVLDAKLCKEIIKEYGKSDFWRPSSVGTGQVARDVRNVDSIYISNPNLIKMNEQVRKSLDDRVFEGAGKAIRLYNEKFPLCRIQKDSGYDLLKYTKGQFYVQHCDSFYTHPRAVSCSFALNDNYEGGEWAFFNQKIKIKPKVGSVIMFPSSFQYPHEILTVTKGTRYAIITWFL